MSEPTNETEEPEGPDLIALVTNVAPSFFDEPETMGSHRFSERVEVTPPTTDKKDGDDDEDEEDEDPTRPPRRRDGEWSSIPSVTDQMIRAPESVRFVGQRAAVYNLSDTVDLDKWNAILELTEGSEASMVIMDSERNFYNGSYVLFATVARIEYRRI